MMFTARLSTPGACPIRSGTSRSGTAPGWKNRSGGTAFPLSSLTPRWRETAVPEDELYHRSPSMDWHNKDNSKNTGDMRMDSVADAPDNLEDSIDFSHITQAEVLKLRIEHFRRRRPHCSGTLMWHMDDCWPVQSRAVLDCYGFGKASYLCLKRVHSPVLASFRTLPAASSSGSATTRLNGSRTRSRSRWQASPVRS